MKHSLLVVFGLFLGTLSAQKKIIDHTAYNSWNKIGDVTLSDNGKYTAYTIKPHQGDGFLYLINNETGTKDSVARGVEPKFTANGERLVFKISPGFDTLRKLELKKVPKDKWVKDSLGIWFTANDSMVKFPKLKEVKIAADGQTIAFLSQTNDLPEGYLSAKEKKKQARTEKKKKPAKTDGKCLTVLTPEQKKFCQTGVTQFDLCPNGSFVAFTTQTKHKCDSVQLHVLTTSQRKVNSIPGKSVAFSGMNFGTSNSNFVGMSSTDTTEIKRWKLWMIDASNGSVNVIADSSQNFETNRGVSNNFTPRLVNNDKDVLFGVWTNNWKPVKDTLLENEKVKLDLWSWDDQRIQPHQLNELKSDQNQTNLYVYHVNSKSIVQLGRDSLDIRLSSKSTIGDLFATCADQYEFKNWESPIAGNEYRISFSDGKIMPLRDEVKGASSLSPDGKQYIYWNDKTNHYYHFEVELPNETCVDCAVQSNFLSDINGQPIIPDPLGIIGWTNQSKGALIQAEKDIFYFDVQKKTLQSILNGIKRDASDTNYTYSLVQLEPDSTTFLAKNTLITQFDKVSKAMNVFTLEGSWPNVKGNLVAGSNHHYIGFKRSKNSEQLVYQRHSNTDYPDLYLAGKNGIPSKQISLANPQQSQYNWSTVELIKWTSYSGIPLEGLVYKPENFDPNKDYPMLVYFYELYADEIHNHYAPRPTASIIHPTEYASAGYVIFIPDIRYTPGHPANGAYDCIMSGTDAVLKKYNNIDPKRLGLQGQSWGGYQTAQLITMTDRYKAAMAGAPVSNMISAYGGIRWGSGFSRQFQYEHTQSRIGKTIWEAPELYIENSPLFHLPKVKTPLLIMANDQDGAVPWYQGIELYMGMRRLQKPAWMLNYNGDDHNLMKNANRFDLSIRMRQFFDYYLLEQPMPLWMKEGIPALDKGKTMKYETAE